MYIYRDHLYAGLYTSKRKLSYNDLYCEECGDSDDDLGYYDTWADFIKELDPEDCYCYSTKYLSELSGLSEEEVYNLNKEYFDSGDWDDKDEGE